jgi:hypothetical protein
LHLNEACRIDELSRGFDLGRVAPQISNFGWYWLVFSWYHIVPTDTKGKLVWYQLVSNFWREPLFPKKWGCRPLFKHSAPLLSNTGFPADFSKKELMRNFKKRVPTNCNCTVQKIPTGFTNQPVLVSYRYWLDGQYWDGMQQ